MSAAMEQALKQFIAGRVRGVFNDADRGERPVVQSDDGLFPTGSVVRRVHGDVTSMMVGGVAALLLQMLHPKVLAGVWDHSNFRADMHGRLRRTARFIALTTYGGRDEAEGAIARVRAIHARVGGTLPDGSPYAADDPDLLLWVHVTEAMAFLDAWIRYGEPAMSRADQDRYFADMALVGRKLGVVDPPLTRSAALCVLHAMRPDLRVDERTREVARAVLRHRPGNPAVLPFQQVTFHAAIDLLPAWARRLHGLSSPPLARPAVRAATSGLARTLRWAFA